MPEMLIGCITKTDLIDHYRSIWSWFKDVVVGHYLGIVFVYGGRPVFKRNDPSTKRPFIIDTLDDLERIVNLHGIEIVPDIERIDEPGSSRMGIIDVDSYTTRERTIVVVSHVVEMLRRNDVDPYFVSTGSSAGLHIRWDIPTPVSFGTLKADIVSDILVPLWTSWSQAKDYMLDPHVLSYRVADKQNSDKVFLDLASLKTRGGVKAIGTVNAKTGAIVKIVSADDLGIFKPTPWEVCPTEKRP